MAFLPGLLMLLGFLVFLAIKGILYAISIPIGIHNLIENRETKAQKIDNAERILARFKNLPVINTSYFYTARAQGAIYPVLYMIGINYKKAKLIFSNGKEMEPTWLFSEVTLYRSYIENYNEWVTAHPEEPDPLGYRKSL